MIIDIHTHQSQFDDRGRRIPWPAPEWIDTVLASASRCGIEKLCLLGDFTLYPPPEDVTRINDCTMAMVARHPGRVFGLCYLNASHDPDFIQQEISRCVRDGPLSGIKLELEVNARDRRLDPIMRRAAELNVFVLHHAWYKTVQKYEGESDPSDVADLARRHPHTTILMAHLTAGGVRGVNDIRDLPNVLVDTSGSQPVAGVVEYAVATLGASRVVFGSDITGRDFSAQLGRVLGARLSEEDRQAVLWANAARLLKCDTELKTCMHKPTS